MAVEYYMRGDDERTWKAADRASRLVKDNDYLAAGNNLVLAQIEKRQGRGQESQRHLSRAQENIHRALQDHFLDPDILAEAVGVCTPLPGIRPLCPPIPRFPTGGPLP